MGLFKSPREPPVTAGLVDPRMGGQTEGEPKTDSMATGDVEKSGVVEKDGGPTTEARIDPELERRVVRKIDYHVPPLVTFLCTSDFRILKIVS
jgi:hypothetical protein